MRLAFLIFGIITTFLGISFYFFPMRPEKSRLFNIASGTVSAITGIISIILVFTLFAEYPM